MSPDCFFLCVDPLSHQFCCEKERCVQSIFLHSGDVACKETGHWKISVSRSILEPFIQPYCNQLHLQINRDIKFSCHVWFQLLHKQSNVSPGHMSLEPLQTPAPIEKVLIFTQLPCIHIWVKRLRQTCHTNIWQLRDSSEDGNVALMNRLLHSWSQYGGVLCIPYTLFPFRRSINSRMNVISKGECLSPSLLILDNYDSYLDSVKKKQPHEGFFKQLHCRILVTCQANLGKMEHGIELSHSIQRDLKNIRGHGSLIWDTIMVPTLFEENQNRGVKLEEKSVTWSLTAVQERMMEQVENNNLRTFITIHPSLVFDTKLMNNKQYDPQVDLVTSRNV